MCGKKLRNSSLLFGKELKGSSKLFKVLVVSSLLLFLVLGQVMAFPFSQKESAVAVDTQKVQNLSEVQSEDYSSLTNKELLQLLKDYESQLENSKKITQEIKEAYNDLASKITEQMHLEEVEDSLQSADKEEIKKDEEKIESLEKEVEKDEKTIKKLKSPKFYADFGLSMGYQHEEFRYGFMGDFGMRFSHFRVGVGANYMFGSFSGLFKKENWSLDNLSLSVMFGIDF